MSMIDKKNEIRYFLAIDFGKSRVGLATADSETRISFAYKTLKNDHDFFQNLAEIINEKNIKTVIVGVPTCLNREKIEYDGETLGKKMKEVMPFLEVDYQNEMFTTKIAQRNLIEKGIKKIKKHDDQEAARIILQSWLDKKYEKL